MTDDIDEAARLLRAAGWLVRSPQELQARKPLPVKELRDSLRELLTIVQAVTPKINDEAIDRAKDILARLKKPAK